MASPPTGPLFCPFCRECFDDTSACPDHDLPLVPFDRLPRRGGDLPRDDETLPTYEVRFGRGLLFGAAVLTLIGFSLPFITTTVYEPLSATGFEVASRVAPYLWAVPLVGAAWVSVLARRRTPRQMRSVRIAVPLLSLIGLTALGYGVHRIRQGAVQLGEEMQTPVTVDLEIGLWVMVAAMVLGVASAFRLGVLPAADAGVPHGGAPDDEGDDRIDMGE